MTEALIAVQIEALPEGQFLATSEELPGLVAQGRTLQETLEIAQDVARKLVESYIENNDDLPPALKIKTAVNIQLSIPVSVD
ncbi:MAG: type II toxin-antitoxin system HicB family antitoxin [Chloroflexi bacterium]|nr:type II toxin-antitoxin system HicB family antitoxin [Chloroflexota bacterium]MCI0868915.1 type II toxin-antitoxin system HicB family antitoxin [Chloroflexota bacterium]